MRESEMVAAEGKNDGVHWDKLEGEETKPRVSNFCWYFNLKFYMKQILLEPNLLLLSNV
jgi:hypothetical protein